MHRLIQPVTSTRRCWVHPPSIGKPGRHACRTRIRRMVHPVAVLAVMALTGAGRSLADVRPETMNGPRCYLYRPMKKWGCRLSPCRSAHLPVHQARRQVKILAASMAAALSPHHGTSMPAKS